MLIYKVSYLLEDHALVVLGYFTSLAVAINKCNSLTLRGNKACIEWIKVDE